jgi:hypothetical protein
MEWRRNKEYIISSIREIVSKKNLSRLRLERGYIKGRSSIIVKRSGQLSESLNSEYEPLPKYHPPTKAG